MRAVVRRSFYDLKEGRGREAGEEFELTEERFAEINRRLNGYIAEADAPKGGAEGAGAEEKPAPKPRPRRRTAASKAKRPENK